MDYLEGRSLKEIIKEHELAGKGMSFDQAWPIIKQTADALNHVHEKAYVHRDIKPANIFLTNEGVIKLLDFGISLRRDLTNSSDATNYIGQGISLPWAAYEHISQFTTPDIRDDIYSLAYVVYQLLTAKHPFQGKHAVEVKSEREQNKLPKELTKPDNVQLTDAQWKALKWGLELQRDNRPTNISEWLAEFGSKQVSRSSFKLSYKFLAAGLVSLLLVIGVWFGFVKNYSGNDDAASVELKKQTEVEKTIPVSPPPLPVVVQEPIYISILDTYPSIPNFNYTFNKDGYLSVVIKDVKAARENKKEVLFFIYPANQDIDVSLNSQNVDLKGGVIDPFEYRNKLRREQGKRPLELESGEYEVLTFFSSNPLSSYKETFDESRNVRESVLTNSNVYYKNNKINIFNRNVLKK